MNKKLLTLPFFFSSIIISMAHNNSTLKTGNWQPTTDNQFPIFLSPSPYEFQPKARIHPLKHPIHQVGAKI